MKFIKSTLPLLILLVAFSSSALAQTSVEAVTEESSQISTISVKGVTCANDLNTISENVKKLEGVSSCEVLKQGAISKFEVKFDPALVTEKAIHMAIEGTGGCKNPDDRPYKVKL